MKYAIEIENLSKSYRGIKAVDNLSIHVPEGKVYGFLGRNGAGKTTTLRMIMGLIRPASGRITVFGRDAGKERIWASRQIGSIVETPGFYENLTARANMELRADMYGTGKDRIGEVLDIVGLGNTGKKKLKEFSLGMKQRLGIATALIHSPRILILDEPTNGLDPEGIKDLRKFIRGLSENQGITVMVSSHILSEVQQVADYAGIIDRGRLIEEIDVQSLNQEDQSYLMLEVDKVEQTTKLLADMKLSYRMEEGKIKVFCNREMNSRINKSLVMAEVNVFNLASIHNNLEERFLSVISAQSA